MGNCLKRPGKASTTGSLMKKPFGILLLVLIVAAAFFSVPRFAQAGDGLPVFESCMDGAPPGWVLGGVGSGWTAHFTSGNEDPTGQGWLRLTSATTNQAGYAYYDYAFHSSYGIIVSFEYTAWGGTGADGTGFFLFDGSTQNFSIGDVGGSLGYANGCSINGLSNAYVGIGLDEYGNFANPADRCKTGGPGQVANSVTVRGSGNGTIGYNFLVNVPVASYGGISIPGQTSTRPNLTAANYRKVLMTITPDKKLTLSIQFGAGNPYTTLINQYNLGNLTGQAPLPATLKLGFFASTGASTNYHELRNISAAVPADLAVTKTDGLTSILPGNPITYTVVFSNNGPNDVENAAISDLVPASITAVSWTSAASSGSSCGQYSGSGNNITTTVSLLNGGNATFTIDGTVSQTLTGPIVNTATISPPVNISDSNPNNNSATDTDTAPPAVTTLGATGVGTGTATLNGNLTSLGSASSVTVSFQYATDAYYIANSGNYNSATGNQTRSTTGTFTANLTGLSGATTYHFRARAVGNGTAYGEDMTFRTGTTPPTVVTNAATNVTTTSATLNGNLTSMGTATLVNVSFEWGETINYGNQTTAQGRTSIGNFSAALTALSPGTTYHFRAKAVGNGSAVGADMAFTTLSVPPSVTTTGFSDVTTNLATLYGNLTSLGTASPVTVSFQYATDAYYASNGNSYNSETTPQSMTATGPYNSPTHTLLPGTTYHFRAKALGDGTSYGGDMTFTTTTTPPSVISQPATNITFTSATLNGNLTSLGTAASGNVSFQWTTDAYYTSHSNTYDSETSPPQQMSDPGNFSFTLNSLSAATTYHFRAKAVGHGTAYGADMSFTTSGTLPNATITTDSDVCTQSTGHTASVADAGGNSTYNWSVSGQAMLISGNNTRSITWNALSPGNATISITVTDSHGLVSSSSVNVTVHPLPNATIAAGSDVCAQSTGNTASVVDAGGNATYNWSLSGQGMLTSGNNTRSITWSVLGAGTATISVTVTDGYGCTSSNSVPVTINALPLCTITAPAAVCATSTGNTASVPSAVGNATYNWSITGGTITAGNNTTQITWTAASGASANISVTITNGNGCQCSNSQLVTINALPLCTITAPAAVCATSTGNTASVPSAVGNATYNWSITGGTITAGNNTRQITWTAGSGASANISVTITDGNGCQCSSSQLVTINALPSSTITAPSDVCTQSTGNTASVPSAGGGATYNWSVSGQGIYASGNNTRSITWNALSRGNATIAVTVIDGNGCSSSSSVNVTVHGPDSTITTASSVCTQSTGHSASVPDAGSGATYNWSVTGQAMLTSANNTRSITWNALSPGNATISVTVTDAYGCISTSIANIIVYDRPNSTIAAPSDVCTQSTGHTASVPDAGSGATYNWSVTGQAIVTSGNNTRSITWDALSPGNATISVTVTDASACTSSSSLNVIVHALPVCTITAPAVVCALSTGNTASVPAASGSATYNWSITGGTITAGNNTTQVTWTAGSGSSANISVTITDGNGCQCSNSQLVTINALPLCTITAPAAVCATSTGNTASVPSAVGNATYNWSITGGTTTAGNNTRQITWTAGSGASANISVTITDGNGCQCSSSTVVTINALPSCTITAPAAVCAYSTGNTASVPSAVGNATYNWSITGGTITAGNNTTQITWTAGSGASANISVTITDGNGCQCSNSRLVTVNPRPTATASNNGPVCRGGSISLFGGPNSMASYSWSGPGGYSSNLQNPILANVTESNTGTYTLTVKDANGCSDSDSTSVVVYTPPTVTTGNASNVTPTSATLNGTLVSLGSSSSLIVSFEWGTTTAYGNETIVGTRTTTGSFSANLASLVPYTTYHYRAKAVGDCPAVGNNTTFTTPQIMHTLTMAVNGSGNTTPAMGSYSYAEGSVVSISAAPAAGWHFSNWSANVADPSSASTTVTMDADKTVTATFAQDQYTLTINIVGQGNVTRLPNQATYTYGSSVQLTAVPQGGWSFSSWSGDLSGSTNPDTIVMNGNRTVTATFTHPPAVATDSAQNVTSGSATLRGVLNDKGTAASVSVSFEWATDNYYTNNGNSYNNETTPPWPMLSTGAFSFALGDLSPQTTYHFQAKATGQGTAYGADMTFTAGPLQPPNQPPNANPIQGAACVTLPVTLQSAPFSDPDPGDTHAASQWQIRTSTGDYGSPVYDSGRDTVHLTGITLTENELNYGTTYYWHVRHQDNHGAWSNWSIETMFTTADTPIGSDITVNRSGTNINFNQVNTGGCTWVTKTSVNPVGPAPSHINPVGVFVDVATTTNYAGRVRVGVPYDPSATQNPGNLRLFHWNGSSWEDVTTSVDTTNNIVYGEVNSLSWFFIGGQWVSVAGEGVPVYPNICTGIVAAFGAAFLAFFLRRKLLHQE